MVLEVLPTLIWWFLSSLDSRIIFQPWFDFYFSHLDLVVLFPALIWWFFPTLDSGIFSNLKFSDSFPVALSQPQFHNSKSLSKTSLPKFPSVLKTLISFQTTLKAWAVPLRKDPGNPLWTGRQQEGPSSPCRSPTLAVYFYFFGGEKPPKPARLFLGATAPPSLWWQCESAGSLCYVSLSFLQNNQEKKKKKEKKTP